ncbi:hypothetical protein [Malikia spinosa]|uniref:hypothetical protein n=1 Tax=Malikia spinosa TaxID=86180 RepID=UPI002FDA23C6
MSINARAIATLGIGFGALAISSIGFNAGDILIPPPIAPRRSSGRLMSTHSLPRGPREDEDALLLLLL